jgi:hypothetical protein
MIATAKVNSCGPSQPGMMASTGEAAIKTTSSPRLMATLRALPTMMFARQGDVVNKYEFFASTIARKEGCAHAHFEIT